MKIKDGCIVELEYELKDDEGIVVESSSENGPMTYLHGNGEVPLGLEKELLGKGSGAALVVSFVAGEAFGPHDPDMILAVPRDQFPEDAEIVPGDWITVQVEDDENPEAETGEMEMCVVEISPDAITLDANHPLAGKAVTFDVKVLSVRAATPEEMAERDKAGSEDDEADQEEADEERAN